MEVKKAALRPADSVQPTRRKSHMRAPLMVLVTVGFVCAAAIVIGIKITRNHDIALATAERNLSAVATSLANQTDAVFFALNALMDQGASLAATPAGSLRRPPAPMIAALAERINASGWASALTLFDADGAPIYEAAVTLAEPAGAVPIDRILDTARGDTALQPQLIAIDGLFLSKTLVGADGRISGLVVVTLAADFAARLSRSINYDARKHVVLANDAGAVLAVSPASSGPARTVRGLLGVSNIPLTDTPQPQIDYTETAAGESLLVVAQPIAQPLSAILVAERLDDVLANWRSELVFYGLILAALVLFGLTVCTMILMQTAEHRQQLAVRRSNEARLKQTIAGANCGIWEWDLRNDTITWSASMYALIGRYDGRKSVAPADIHALMHPEDRAALDRIKACADKDKKRFDEVFRLRHAHGNWVWIHAKGGAAAMTDPAAGPATRLTGIATDVTALKQAESRITEAESRLRDAIENISEAFVLWDSDDKLVLCNKNFAAFYCIDPSVLRVGARRREVMVAASTPVEVMHEAQAEDAETGDTTELQLVGGRWIRLSTRKTSSGGQVSVGTDVTPLKEQEAELLGNEKRLTAYVAELKASEERLRREASERAELAKKYASEKTRAVEASRSKTEFLANMSHELRTPLNAIMGFAQIMQDGMFGALGDDKYRDYANDIIESSQSLLDLINDILDMSKIESGRMELEIGQISLHDVLKSCVRMIEPKVFDAGLHLTYDLPDLPKVYADPRATKQTLLNLLSNAVKFTQRGGSISITAEHDDATVTLAVADTGIGIAKEHLPRIAKPFEQIESQQSKRHKGSGLGLALSKSLMELQGGTLAIESELGIGTTIRIGFRQSPPPAKNTVAKPASPPPAGPEAASAA